MNSYSKNHKFLIAALVLVFGGAFTPEVHAANRCESIFMSEAERASYMQLLQLDHQGLGFAKGSAKTAGKEIQFGFESEYTINELAPFTNFYGPTPESGISKQAWLSMPLESRMGWIKEKLKSIPFGAKDPVLVLMEKSPELGFLPSKLIRDDTGNVEIILDPVSDFGTWKKQVQWVNRNFGVGSMQSMVSQPRETFYADTPGYKEVAFKENLGYFNFFHQADVLERMASGAQKFQNDPTKEVMKPFLHPYLGPMMKMRHKKMVNTLEAISDGQVLTKEDLEAVVRREQSFKYIGSTAYRPDIGGPHRMSQEVRDAHKDEGLLIDRTARSVFYAQQGRSAFMNMADVAAFDSMATFSQLPTNTQAFLKKIFPVKAPKQIQEFENALFVHETYRNFSYPMKSWRSTLQAIDRMDLVKTVETAQATYMTELQKIENDLNSGHITVEQASAQVQGALAQFAINSKLHEAFKKFEADIPAKYSKTTESLVTPRRGLEFRLQTFLKKWANSARLVDSVTFKYKDEKQKTASDRKMLVLSTEGLSSAEIARLETDYVSLVAGNITFPLKERASHTLVQFNGTIFNFGYAPIQAFPRFRQNDFQAGQSRRLESVLMLTRGEESRFNYYIQNIRKDKKAVLGKFNLEGDPKTNGKLTDNRSECGNNCTTWIAKAPIGERGESVMDLAGGQQSVPWVAQNPGWWNSWILGTASQERLPLVVYWTPESLAKTMEKDFSGNTFNWDFNRK
ncbi:hypothetical protein [Bdellovibrio sp. HCB-110]|uniref:hypothetical protein n=1 Tax=Bdellovibrio sp. HCB-110 TaxID=3391182 RepID=UPI0039B62A22